MKNNYFFKKQFSNIYKKASKNSEVTSQIIYGEKFKILSKNKKWIKIKTLFDKYIGYIENKDYVYKHDPKYKVYSLKARVSNESNKKTKNFLPFGSKVDLINENKNYIEFEKNKWLKKSDLKKINHKEKNYTKIFNKFKNKIKKGETYQIKICTKYRNKSKIDPLDYFCRLTKTNLAPEAFFIKDKEYSIISCSPETLIIKKGNSISTKPIAGTLKKNSKLDKNKALNYFRKNIKETKKHNMIVDMERNDLSRICQPGTVKIAKEKIVEEYKDLFHYVSLINGKLKKNIQNIDIIKSMMPGGSVIGCPKISTLNLLNHQEKEERNIYTGSFGYIKFNGDMKFNIIIRSILYYKNISEISVASGVVIDSNPKNEFDENFIKAKALIDLYK